MTSKRLILEACSASCLACETTEDNCISCPSGKVMHSSTCQDSCPDNTYESASECLDCDSPCATCFGSSSTCLSCIPSQFLYESENRCYLTCPDGTLPNSSTMKCDGINYIKDVQTIIVDCDTVCGTCSGTIDNCVTCTKPPHLYLHESTCKNACPIGTTEFPSNVCAGYIHLCFKDLIMC